MNSRHLSEAAWVVGGVIATALGTLLGVRLLTQFVPPETYGVITLALGMVTLTMNVACTPLTQAAMHAYPELAARGQLPALRASLVRCLRRMALWALPAAIAATAAYLIFASGSLLFALLLAVLLVNECWRSVNLSLLNAARRHKRYSLWMSLDAWGRPLLGTAAVLLFSNSATTVIEAYVAVSLVLLLVFSRGLWPAADTSPAASPAHSQDLDGRLWRYALPLLPLGLIGWTNNLGDRYLIGGILGLADAGVYAAVYGLSSAPFMLVGGTIEQALRPVYQTAVAAGQQIQAQRLFVLWLSIVTVVCGLGVIAMILWHEAVAKILLAAPYRHAAGLMPWIAAGYTVRCVSYVFERVCYAYAQTRRVLFSQILAALATLVATPLGALHWGLAGSAMAVPVYFTVQLVAAALFARKTLKEATALAPQPAAVLAEAQ